MKLYIFNIYILSVTVCECICTVGVCITRPIRSLYERTSLYVFSTLRHVKNKFAKLFLFVFIILVLFNIYEPFSVVPSFPNTQRPSLYFSHTIYVIFKTRKQKLTHIIYTPPDCHPKALQCTSGKTIQTYNFIHS